jgi:hypothetical protein
VRHFGQNKIITLSWENLKNKVYFLNGSLRDIYVRDTTKEDWQKWSDFVNANYKTSFYTIAPAYSIN